jgi:4-aminobutyrate aminotransferase-like enzyme
MSFTAACVARRWWPHAQGAYIFDAGKPYLDACGGAAVCLGHAHPDVLAAMHRQIDRLAYAHTSFFTSDASSSWPNISPARRPASLTTPTLSRAD